MLLQCSWADSEGMKSLKEKGCYCSFHLPSKKSWVMAGVREGLWLRRQTFYGLKFGHVSPMWRVLDPMYTISGNHVMSSNCNLIMMPHDNKNK